jgi:predicted nuclease of predicted toxin-antitoxin system
MKFLLDQNLPVVLAKWLVARGHEAEHAKRLGLQEADDLAIMRHAMQTGAIVITKDGDFRHLAGPLPKGPQIVWIRFGNTTNPQLLETWEPLWPSIEQALAAGERLIEIT